MTKTLDKEKVEQLVAELMKHNEEYYRDGKPSLSDEEYDKKKLVLSDWVTNFPEYADIAEPILKQVGSPSLQRGFKKAKHAHKMLSLESIYDAGGFQNWLKYCGNIVDLTNYNFQIQPKLDGLSIELIYEEGKFIQAITRGDGTEGEDVTENIKATGEVPEFIEDFAKHPRVSVCGEVIIHKSDFNTHLKDEFKNPRNAAVGSLKQLDSSVIPKRYLRVYVYDLFSVGDGSYYYNSLKNKDIDEKMKILGKKFRVVPFSLSATINEIPNVFKNMIIWRNTYDIEMDGIVIKVNSEITQAQLGNKPNAPIWAIAWKFNAMAETSTVEEVNWSISKAGTLTPVAKIKPTDIGGVTVTNVNLHNYDFATKILDLKIGDEVQVRRAGDVIPEIVSVNKTARHTNKVEDLIAPTECPKCGSNTTFKGLDLICPNPNGICLDQTIHKLSHFVSKEAVNIDGMSEKTLRVMVEDYGVRKPLDLYTFDYDKLKLTQGFRNNKINNLRDAMEKSKDCDKASFMYAMSIPEVGKSTAVKIIDKLKISRPQQEWYECDRGDIGNLSIDGIGDAVANSINDWNYKGTNRNQDFYDLVKQFNFMLKVTPNPAPSVGSSNANVANPIYNMAVLFTGTLNTMALTRSQARAKVEALGGWECSGLSSCNILIVGNKPGSKLKNAQNNSGITIMGETEFAQICRDNNV